MAGRTTWCGLDKICDLLIDLSSISGLGPKIMIEQGLPDLLKLHSGSHLLAWHLAKHLNSNLHQSAFNAAVGVGPTQVDPTTSTFRLTAFKGSLTGQVLLPLHKS